MKWLFHTVRWVLALATACSLVACSQGASTAAPATPAAPPSAATNVSPVPAAAATDRPQATAASTTTDLPTAYPAPIAPTSLPSSPAPLPSTSTPLAPASPSISPTIAVSGDQPEIRAGLVQQIDGTTLTLSQLASQSTVNVHVADGATIQKLTSASRDALRIGTAITVLGVQNGTTLQALRIQIGMAVALEGGGPLPGSEPPAGMPRPGGGQPLPSDTPNATVSGTIGQITGDTVAVQRADGTTTSVQLDTNSVVQQLSAATANDIQSGTFVIASGHHQDSSFQASQITIITAPTRP
jgi:hypothetical protein